MARCQNPRSGKYQKKKKCQKCREKLNIILYIYIYIYIYVCVCVCVCVYVCVCVCIVRFPLKPFVNS